MKKTERCLFSLPSMLPFFCLGSADWERMDRWRRLWWQGLCRRLHSEKQSGYVFRGLSFIVMLSNHQVYEDMSFCANGLPPFHDIRRFYIQMLSNTMLFRHNPNGKEADSSYRPGCGSGRPACGAWRRRALWWCSSSPPAWAHSEWSPGASETTVRDRRVPAPPEH